MDPPSMRKIGFRSVEHAGIGNLVRPASFKRKVTIFHKKIQTRKDVDSLNAYLTSLSIPCQKIEEEVKRNRKAQAIQPGLFFFPL